MRFCAPYEPPGGAAPLAKASRGVEGMRFGMEEEPGRPANAPLGVDGIMFEFGMGMPPTLGVMGTAMALAPKAPGPAGVKGAAAGRAGVKGAAIMGDGPAGVKGAAIPGRAGVMGAA